MLQIYILNQNIMGEICADIRSQGMCVEPSSEVVLACPKLDVII
jgi:hypothetical protein